MATEHFTTEEGAQGTSGSFGLLVRYLRHVPVLRLLIIPTLLMAAVVAGAYQLFIWLSGEIAKCSSEHSCAPREIVLGLSLEPSLALLCALAAFVTLLKALQWNLFETVGQVASRGLLREMLQGVARTRTTFFDEYPSGKIINRLVKDSDSLRLFGPIRLGDSMAGIVELIVVSVMMSFASAAAALLSVPTFIFFLWLQRNIAPMLQKTLVLRSARFGEVLHRETDVIEGVRSFVLYGQLSALMERLASSVYRFMQMHFLRGGIEAWGRCLTEIAVAVHSSAVLGAVYVGIHYGHVTPVVGVVIITGSFRLGTIFSWLTWSFGLLFETAGHCRRVFEYVDLPIEEAEEGNTPVPCSAAPGALEGDLQFVGYTMSYREATPTILDDLSLTIARGSKVGLVGRTGAGKSSLVQSLFRMVHVKSGNIRVGGASLLAMPLDSARSLFAVVPQDPYLFEGTIRSNIDRLGEFTDGEITEALRAVQLPLDTSMALREGGTNLSLGQRQLLCLARVMLTKRPFVIMDEPTSGVDSITDAIMQSVLRTALHGRTIITIAHRLETLSRMDRVIELEDGRVVRDGTPAEILKDLTPAELA